MLRDVKRAYAKARRELWTLYLIGPQRQVQCKKSKKTLFQVGTVKQIKH